MLTVNICFLNKNSDYWKNHKLQFDLKVKAARAFWSFKSPAIRIYANSLYRLASKWISSSILLDSPHKEPVMRE